MNSREVRNWLSKVKDLEMEKTTLEERRLFLLHRHNADAQLLFEERQKYVPDPNKVGGRSNNISKPTEDDAIKLAEQNYSQRINDITQQIEKLKSEIDYIINTAYVVYKELNATGSMSGAEWYTIDQYYFKNKSEKEIMESMDKQLVTVKGYKSRGIRKLAESLPRCV